MELKPITLRSEPTKAIKLLLAEEDRKTKEHIMILNETRWGLPRISLSYKFPPRLKLVRKEYSKPLNLGEDFEYTRHAAMTMFRYSLISRVKLFGSSFSCSHVPEHTMREIPSSMFSWSYDDFLRRYSKEDLAFSIQLFKVNVPSHCWEVLKFQKDFVLLEVWLGKLFAKELDESAKWKGQMLLNELRQDIEYLDIFKNLRKDISQQYEKVQKEIDILNRLNFNENDNEAEELKSLLKEQLNNLDAWHPIELRYQTRWLNSKQYQYELRCNNEVDAIKDEVRACQEEIDLLNYTTTCTVTATKDEIAEMNRKYNDFKNQFDKEFEQAEYVLSTFQRNIQNMKDQRKFQEREIIRFQNEIDQIEAKIEQEREAEPVVKVKIVKKGCATASGKKGKKKK